MVSTAVVNKQAAHTALNDLESSFSASPAAPDLSHALKPLRVLKTSAHAQKSQALKLLTHAGEELVNHLLISQTACSDHDRKLLVRLCRQLRSLIDNPVNKALANDDPYLLVRHLTDASNALRAPKPQPTASALTRRLRRRGDHPREQARFVDQVLDATLSAEMAINANPGHAALDQVSRSLHAIAALAAFLGLESIVAHIHGIEERLTPLLAAGNGVEPENLNWLRGTLDHLRLLAVDPHHGSTTRSELNAEVKQHQLEELVEISNHLRGILKQHSIPEIDAPLARLHTLSRELLLVPLLPICQRLSHSAREIAERMGRIVTVSTSGEHLAIPRTLAGLVEACSLPLIRNALDHGIEPPSHRRRAGKPESGNLHIAALTIGRSLLIRISDDGSGIDPDAVVRIAVEKNLISTPMHLELRDKLRLILITGFTSATDTNGRGVGLDVVLDTLENSAGSLEIESTPGAGTSFVLRWPIPNTL